VGGPPSLFSWHGPNNSFKPTPHRGVNSVLYATLHAVAAPLRVGLTQALGPAPMFQEIHDSLLVAYSVNSEASELVMHCQPHHGCGNAPFSVVFAGVSAHCFEFPLLPSILLDITQVPAATLLTEEWPAIERGSKQCGWPGSWAQTLAGAVSYAEASKLHGFQIGSSYGLEGWVLAQSARVASGP
jgi:hypothetical protein